MLPAAPRQCGQASVLQHLRATASRTTDDSSGNPHLNFFVVVVVVVLSDKGALKTNFTPTELATIFVAVGAFFSTPPFVLLFDQPECNAWPIGPASVTVSCEIRSCIGLR